MSNHTETPQIEIERASYDEFLSDWGQGKFEGQRLGQAFYNHFHLHRLTDQTSLQNLYDTDGKKARRVISLLFQIR